MSEKQPGVWEVRVFTGNDARWRPTQISRTVRGLKRDAQLSIADVECWHTRLRRAGMQDAGILNRHGVAERRVRTGSAVGLGEPERRGA